MLRKEKGVTQEHLEAPVLCYNNYIARTYGSVSIIKVTFDGTRAPYQAYHVPYIRVSDEDKQMSQDEYDDLLRIRDDKSKAWESQRSKYTVKDIDRATFNRYLRMAKKVGRISFEDDDPPSVLEVLGLSNGRYLLNAGAAIFVKSRINDLQIAKFVSDEKLTFSDMKRYHGSILELIDKAVEYLSDAMDWRIEFDGRQSRIEIPEIPLDALREAVTNAFAHRLIEGRESVEICIYKSTIEISSSGSFPKNMTPQMFVERHRKPIRRNPLITRTLYYSKDMESHATGLKRIQSACDATGCIVEYRYDAYEFTVIFHRHCGDGWSEITAPESTAKLPPNYHQTTAKLLPKTTTEKVYEIIHQTPNISVRNIAESLGITEDGVRYHIKKLSSSNAIKRVGSSRSGYWEVVQDE